MKKLLTILILASLLVACEGGDPVSVNTCVDDSFEQNDGKNMAKEVNGDSEGVVYENLVVCPDDEDWFKVYVATGELLNVTITFAHASGDLDLTIYDSQLLKLVSATSNTDNESGTTDLATEDGDYMVRIFGASPKVTNNYKMTVKVSTGG